MILVKSRLLDFNLWFFKYFKISQDIRGAKHLRQTSSIDQGNKKQRGIVY
jgi:hypothetical protein